MPQPGEPQGIWRISTPPPGPPAPEAPNPRSTPTSQRAPAPPPRQTPSPNTYVRPSHQARILREAETRKWDAEIAHRQRIESELWAWQRAHAERPAPLPLPSRPLRYLHAIQARSEDVAEAILRPLKRGARVVARLCNAPSPPPKLEHSAPSPSTVPQPQDATPMVPHGEQPIQHRYLSGAETRQIPASIAPAETTAYHTRPDRERTR